MSSRNEVRPTEPAAAHEPAGLSFPDSAKWSRRLLAAGFLAAIVCGTIALISRSFAYEADYIARPILLVLGLLAAGFVIHLFGLAAALRCRPDRKLAAIVFGFAIAFRAILLFSEPIQEVDVYRYLWDGAVLGEGISPFRFAPEDILTADAFESTSGELRQLVALRDGDPALAEILNRVHFGDVPTVYPPVSQAVFLLADAATPDGSGVPARLAVMKSLLLLFDLATVILVWSLLRQTGRHPGWTLAYAWCPLVLKEVANSGHLDAIAVCLTTAAVWCTVAGTLKANTAGALRLSVAAGVLLGLAVGAKLYPVVLVPLVTLFVWSRLGRRAGMVTATAAVVTSAVALAPMVFSPSSAPPVVTATTTEAETATFEEPRASSLTGLRTFIAEWEINDFLFLLVYENLRPPRDSRPTAWFAVVPRDVRENVSAVAAERFRTEETTAAFLLTRVITGLATLVVALLLAARAARARDVLIFLECAFLTIAWFWALQPTLNPWYWMWALPLIPFARGRSWLAVSLLVLVYYLRFWLLIHWPSETIAGTRYGAADFFDLVVTWCEHVPWLAALAIGWLWRTGKRQRIHSSSSSRACSTQEKSRARDA